MATFDNFMKLDIRVGTITVHKYLKRQKNQHISFKLISAKRLG